MKKTILSVAVATTLGLTMGAAQATEAAIPENCTAQENHNVEGGVVNVVCTTLGGSTVVFEGEQYENGNWDMDLGGVGKGHDLDGGGKVIGGGYVDNIQYGSGEGAKIIAVEDTDGHKVAKGVYTDGDGTAYDFTLITDGEGAGNIIVTVPPLREGGKERQIVIGTGAQDEFRDLVSDHLSGMRGERGIDTVNDVLAGLNKVSELFGEGNIFTYDGDNTFTSSAGDTFTVQEAKDYLREQAELRGGEDAIPTPIKHIDLVKEKVKEGILDLENLDIESKKDIVNQMIRDSGNGDNYRAVIKEGELVIVNDQNEVVQDVHALLIQMATANHQNRVADGTDLISIGKKGIKDRILEDGKHRRQERRSDRDMKGNPDNTREAATVIVKHKVDNMDGESKAGLVNNMLERGDSNYQITDAGLTIDGESYVELTDKQGNVLQVSVDEFKAAALAKQAERKTERDLDNAPKLGGERWSDAVTNLTEAGENLMVLGLESKAKLQAGAQGIKASAEDLTEAGQTMKTDLTAGKSELEAAAQSATEQMAAQFAAMQKQLDEQAKLIAELQNGENPSVPSTGISPEAESALRDASATLQAKMDVAVNKLQGAAKTLQEKGSKLVPQDPDFGINPPSQGVPTHELGSIGEGQAVAYVQNGLEELYNTGNEQAQQYADKALSDAKSYTDTQIAGINSRIDGIEEDLETVMATSQAVTAARPYLSSNQTNAIGVGLGNSGSQNAIAVGYAHRINENWTANANLSGTSGNEVDYSVGAGLSYAW